MYVALPLSLMHLRDMGNQWSYSLTGPWFSRTTNPLVGDVHFSPSEVGGFDYWVYRIVGLEAVWCLCALASTHPTSDELVLQHRTVDTPPQWVRSWPGLDLGFMYTP